MRLAALLAVTLAVLLAACGRKGPEANQTYFWRLDAGSSTVEWGDCSDDPSFRSQVAPIAIGEDEYIIYKISADGRHATSMSCRAIDPKSCEPLDGGMVFDVAGNQLTFTESFKDDAGSGCNMVQDVTWTLTDQLQLCSVEIANALSLVDNPAVCDTIESNLQARSPNKLGVRGCIVTFRFVGQ